jgi:transcriptional regulator with XRE-family HTH domain
METSRKLALTDWTKANDALILYFEGNKSKFAERIKMSRTTLTAFFNGEPIREGEFRKVCTALNLDWQEISTISFAPSLSRIFPEDFLTDFAERKAHPKLSDRESQIFRMLFGQGKTRVQIQQVINVSGSALMTERLSCRGLSKVAAGFCIPKCGH